MRKIILLLSLCVMVACSGREQTPTPTTAPTIQPPDPNRLTELDSQIEAGDYGEIHSLLIQQQGQLIWESYYNGYNANRTHFLYSVTKSITSAALGVAIENEQVAAVETPLFDLLPDTYQTHAEGAKATITLEDMLTMTAGLAWDESGDYSTGQNDAVAMGQNTQDWVDFVLARDLVNTPGETFVYNSGVSMVLGQVLAHGTSQSAEDFTEAALFEPLGITQWRWDQGIKGITNTGWGLHMRPNDMLKIGQLFLQEGVWEGEVVIPAGWVNQSTQTQFEIDGAHTYGYQWWRFADTNGHIQDLTTNDLFFAWGYGGQFIFIIPHLEMVIVTTAGNFQDGSVTFGMLSDHIFK